MGKKFYIGLSIFSLLVGLVSVITLLRAPYLGIKFESKDKKWFIASVDPDGPARGLKEYIGAKVVAIGDFQLQEFDLLIEDPDLIHDAKSFNHFWEAQKYFAEHIKKEIPLAIHIIRGQKHKGEITEISNKAQAWITPSSYPLQRIIVKISLYYFIGFFCLLLGLLVAMKKPDDILAMIFFILVFAASLVFLPFGGWAARNISFDYITTIIFMRVIASFAFSYCPVIFLHFCLIFPSEKKLARNKPFLMFIYTATAAITLLFQQRIIFSLYFLLFVGCLLSGIIVMVYSYVKLKSPRERAQIKWVLWGTSIFAFAFLLTDTFPKLFPLQDIYTYSSLLPSLFFTLMPITMAIAITRYRLMDIDTLFDNTFIYTVTLSVLVLLDMGTIGFFANLKSEAFSIPEPVATIIAVWLVIFAYVPVRNNVKKTVKKILKREMYDLNEVSMKLSRHLLSASDISAVTDKVKGILDETLHPKGIEFFLINEKYMLQKGTKEYENLSPSPTPPIEGGDKVGDIEGRGFPSPLVGEGPGEGYFRSNDGLKVDMTLKTPQHLYSISDAGNIPQDYSGGVIVPLAGSTGAIGFITLKNKYSGRLYSDDDLKLLSTIANQTTLSIENIHNRQETTKKEKEAWEEKQRISREIHDGIGSSLTNAIMMVENIGDERLQNLKTLLTEGLGELRDIIWTAEGEQCTLGDMTFHIKEKIERIRDSNLRFEVNSQIENQELPVSPMRLRNIVKIIQESLANVIKHAAATQLSVFICEKGGTTTITINDNGRGFNVLDIQSQDCHGLKNIQKRCEEMGVELTIHSEAGKGTEVKITIL